MVSQIQNDQNSSNCIKRKFIPTEAYRTKQYNFVQKVTDISDQLNLYLSVLFPHIFTTTSKATVTIMEK